MAKTVDNFSTIEDFRKTYNELAFDVGEVSGLRDALKSGNNDTIVDAINVLEDKQFFFQEFEFIATTNQVSFNGADASGNTLIFKDEKVQVFKNEEHLRENVDYQVALPSGSSHTGITLIGNYASGQSKAMASGDRLTIYSFTGAFIGTNITGDVSSFFQKTAENTIQNINANGVILNGDNSSATTSLESGFTLQLAGRTFAEDDIITTTAGKKFQAPIISDSVASLQSGSLTSAVNGTFSGQVQAEHLKSTDDLEVADDATVGGDLTVSGLGLMSSNFQVNGNVILGGSSSNTVDIRGDIDGDLIPSTAFHKIGDSSNKFSQGHFNQLNGDTITGPLTGDVTGNVTGNVTGDLTGDVKHGGSVVLDASSGALTGTVSSISNHNSGDLSEGSNLYFTNARADARIAAANIGALNNVATSSLANNDILQYSSSSSQFENVNLGETVEDLVGAMVAGGTETGIAVTYTDNDAGDGKLNFVLDNSDFTLSGKVTGTQTQTAKGDVTITTSLNANISDLSDVGSTSGASAGQILVFDGSGNLQVANNSTGTDSISEEGNKYFTDERVAATFKLTSDGDTELHKGVKLTFADNPEGDTDTALDGRITVETVVSNGIKLDSTNHDIELDYSVITDSDLTGGLPSGSGKEIGHLFFLV